MLRGKQSCDRRFKCSVALGALWLVRNPKTLAAGGEVDRVNLGTQESAVERLAGSARAAHAHEGVEDQVSGLRCDLYNMRQDAERLLRRVQHGSVRAFDAFVAHTDGTLEEIVHLLLRFEVPRVTLVPARREQLTAVEEARLEEVRDRVRLVPDHHLKGVEQGIEGFVITAYEIVAHEDEGVARRLEDAAELRSKLSRVQVNKIPFGQVVVDVRAPAERQVSAAVLRDVVGWIGEDQIDGLVGQRAHHFEAVTIEQGYRRWG